MKKCIVLLIVLSMIFSFGACSLRRCNHIYQNATCEAPQTCVVCGKTEGEAGEHDFAPSTCTQASTCKHCGKEEGEPVGHIFKQGKCVVCQEKQVGYDPEKDEELDTSKAFFQEKPSEDGVLRILAIGNSYSLYYMDELYSMLTAAGVNATLTHAYYGSCRLDQHWEFLNNGSPEYTFYTYTESGIETREKLSLEDGLKLENWDIITLQQFYTLQNRTKLDEATASMEPYTGHLVGYLNEKFPYANQMWHQTWAFQVSYTGTDAAQMADAVARQTLNYEVVLSTAKYVCDKYDLQRIPAGDAWQLARADARIGDTLCAFANRNDDGSHDGDIGGGQYLNACVWFESVTGQSCVGNTFRPDYELSEEKVVALQELAHQSIANMAN